VHQRACYAAAAAAVRASGEVILDAHRARGARLESLAVGVPSAIGTSNAHLELLDWRRRVAELFVELRRREPDADTLAWFRAQKDALFREHPQTPVPPAARASFQGLSYWPFDPQARVVARFAPEVDPAAEPSPRADGGEVAFTRIGTLRFELNRQALELGAHWIAGYAGGLFVPFRDATSGSETYGGGRYLVDTIKSADLGSDLAAGTVVLDFNYAYHPSCAYDPRWPCPLAPPENRLALAVRAGEHL
jgi:uncharacterized protein